MFAEAIKSHIQQALNNLYTTLPAKVTKVYKEGNSTVVSVQPLVNKVDMSGKAFVEPELDDVPIVWPSAGGCYITLPVEEGDQVLLHFAMRSCVEYKNGTGEGTETPAVRRSHNANDVFAVPSMLPYQLGTEVDSQAVRISSGATEIRIMKDGTIELGEGATERLIKGDAFLSQFLSHTHTYSNAGTPTLTTPVSTILSIPDVDTLWEANLSEVSKTK